MKKYFTLLLFLPILLSASNTEKVLILKKIDTPIKVDGVIDDAWSKADSATNFFQLQPYFAKQPSRKTYAKVLTTGTSLYCLIVCFDKKENIQSNTGKLDDYGGDVVSIMLDTFGDRRTAYKFAVTASGVRGDCRLLDDARNRDYSWDGIWFSYSRIYDWGYVVEIELPYKSIQYNKELTNWGLDFDRWIPALTEDQYWCEYEQNEGQRISKFGKLIFENFRPSIKGLNLELYPVAFGKINYLGNNKYKVDPNAGLDIFYNPSPQLTVQATANPDFAQIEADPYNFNISRYETFFSERRPFFIQGNEIFSPSGRQRNSGFYRPLELLYSRRIGKKLPDGKKVPLTFGAKAFGRIDDWEYGGFAARTQETEYTDYNGSKGVEPSALFLSGRIKKQVFDNSSIGVLFVGKKTSNDTYGVIDIDGAFRNSDWQLAYQIARSVKNSEGDFAVSAGFTQFGEKWITFLRGNYIGDKFDINQVGYVPWKGTAEFVGLTGPYWYFKEGAISQLLFYAGPALYYEKVDSFTDYGGVAGINMQFRSNWGYEINFQSINTKDNNKEFNSSQVNFSSWFNINPKWNGNVYGGYSKRYNFSRNYLAFYSWLGAEASWKIADILQIGTSYNMWIEGNPDGNIEEITYNARPWFSFTPINDVNFYVYVDNVFLRSSNQMERIFIGALFSFQFSPKSWIYLALNEIHDRNNSGRIMDMTDRVSVFKIKYLYYF
ncbi:MAG: carbohydrate binding family 9 domain-containing protein [Ignavibacteriales bacterium]|nr:carbohydrate binding family 9 domain-containing protein [Ignavibacteriales bacterium]